MTGLEKLQEKAYLKYYLRIGLAFNSSKGHKLIKRDTGGSTILTQFWRVCVFGPESVDGVIQDGGQPRINLKYIFFKLIKYAKHNILGLLLAFLYLIRRGYSFERMPLQTPFLQLGKCLLETGTYL